MCGAKVGGPSLEGVDVTKETVIQGVVMRGGEPVASAYVRLLDEGGDLTAEVATSATGQFRFYARPGTWTLRVLALGMTRERTVHACQGEPVDTQIELSA